MRVCVFIILHTPYITYTVIGKQFRWGRQEDSHEFLRCLIDCVQQSAIATQSLLRQRSVQQHETEIFAIFGGYLQSQVRCLGCGYESDTVEPFMDLSLEITAKNCTSLRAALDAFCAPEILDNANKYKCPRYLLFSLFSSPLLSKHVRGERERGYSFMFPPSYYSIQI
jgi:ubiquitin C-terminal hydrolase